MIKRWYELSVQDVLEFFKVDPQVGLTFNQVEQNLKTYGLNQLPSGKRESFITIFFKQFLDPLIYLLIIAAALVFIIGAYLDASIITLMLFINAFVATIQEGRAQDILSSLKKFIKTQASVRREGKTLLIDDAYVVPGDIILLESGIRVPADARVINSYELSVDESMITGESIAVYKKTEPLKGDVASYQMSNMLFMGSVVTGGSGVAVITGTGLLTQIGELHKEIEKIDTEVPLEKELSKISHFITGGAIFLCCLMFFYGWKAGYSLYELFTSLTVMFVAIVPEELIVVLTMILVGGAYRLAQQQVLVKRLRAVEALGHAEVIVMDKTGTLTRNEMVVEKVYAGRKDYTVTGEGYNACGTVSLDGRPVTPTQDILVYEIGRALALVNTATVELEKDGKCFAVKGNATSAAGVIFAYKLGIDEFALRRDFKEIYRMPFSATARYSASLFFHRNSYIAYIVGSPELLIKKAHAITSYDKEVFETYLSEGFRIVGVARYVITDLNDINDPKKLLENIGENPIEFLGFLALQDALRTEAPIMIEKAHKAGLNVVMATGDHEETARFIGIKTGILKDGDKHLIDGPSFRELSDDQLLAHIDRTHIYSRVTPQDKLRLINLFHKKGYVVAMAGDGVNDAPALIAADLGIAMGERGSSVAHEAADMVLLNDSFGTIIEAIKEGRHIFYRLRQGILYFVITDFALVLLLLISLVLGIPLVLTAIQIMWIHVFSDGFFSIALAHEPVEPGLLEKKWLKKKRNQSLLDKENILRALYLALPMTFITLGYFLYFYKTNLVLARTITFASITIFKWYNAWNCRSENQSIFTLGLFSNRALMISLACVLTLLLAAIYVPFLEPAFETEPLSLSIWVILLIVNSSVVILEELRKYYIKE